jgi:serine/threonine protein kinase
VSSWDKKWKVVKKLPSGGQGDAHIVVPISTDGPEYFMKVLRENRNERRDRMRREIMCYSTLAHPSIPKLIDSNVAAFDDKTVVPYLVTDLITGTPLPGYLQKRGFVPAAEAIRITRKLLEAVQHAHNQETVHRDIKPDNIILTSDENGEPVLVDFGMSFYEDEVDVTFTGQEIGNRFLRLPEFHAGSQNQRDPRSDVTLCAGILYYLLTGKMPRVLQNEDGRPPHQTDAGREALRQHIDIDINALMNVFDRAFDPTVHARFSSASALAEALERISLGPQPMTENRTAEEMIALINQQMQSHEEAKVKRRSAVLKKGITIIHNVRASVMHEVAGLGTIDSGPEYHIREGTANGRAGFIKASDHSVQFLPNYLIELHGEEVVLTFDGQVVFRGNAEMSDHDQLKIASKIRDTLLRGIHAMLRGT